MTIQKNDHFIDGARQREFTHNTIRDQTLEGSNLSKIPEAQIFFEDITP